MATSALDIVLRARDDASKTISQAGQNMTGSLKNVAKQAAAAAKVVTVAVAAAAVAIGGFAIKAAADMETMNVALLTAFQGNQKAAEDAQKTITSFAAKTPFELGEVMRSFIKLKNMGLDPSREALTAYGDTASAMGKSLNDMVEAVADAATGEFERLKEFGIRASSEGDRVTFTFQGVSTTVGKNAEEIEQYLINLGKTKFAGGMEAQSKTLSGMMSTLKDTVSIAGAEFAQSTGLFDAAKQVIANTTGTIDDLTQKGIALFDLFVKGDFTKRFAQAFGVHEDDELVDFLFDIREGVIAFGQAVVETALMAAEYLRPSVERLGQVISTELLPSLKEFWETVSPVLIPALQALAVLLGATLLVAIKFTIEALTAVIKIVSFLARNVDDTASAIGAAFAWIMNRVIWLRDNWAEAIGFVIGFFATLPFKLPLFVIAAIGKIIQYVASIDWGAVFAAIGRAFEGVWNWVKDSAIRAFNFIKNINWGQVLTNVGRGIGNAIMGLIEGAINGALSGIPGAPKINLPRFANGVQNFEGGLAIVGERGPELVRLPRGADVIPNHRLQGNGVTISIGTVVNQSPLDWEGKLREFGWQLSMR